MIYLTVSMRKNLRPESEYMEIKTYVWNGWHVLSIEGEFVVKNLVKVREQLESLDKEHPTQVAFNLEKTTYIDSSAITLMLNYRKKLSQKKGAMVIFGASEDVQSIFSIVGLDSSIKLYGSLDEFQKAHAA
jgi:anti-anti-sigma factor